MLQLRAQLWTRPSCSLRFASHLSPTHGERSPVTTTPDKSPSILSRLSDRTQPGIPHDSGAAQKSSSARTQAAAPRREPRPRVTSFISGRSAHKRDHAAEKWFTDIRKLDVNDVDQSDDLKPLARKKRVGHESWKHEMRPNTDLNALFAPPTTCSAASARLQAKRELGGDYASYLPNRYPDPHQLPVDYARLALGRNKHVSLKAQTGALNIIERAIQGGAIRQDRAA